MVENHLKGRGISDEKVLKAIGQIPREEFIPDNLKERAYFDGPLSIGEGQTISQPYIVALMTEQLELSDNDTVLEVGTGSGYQAAILSLPAKKVYTIDRFRSLSEKAQAVLKKLNIDNIVFAVGDGSCGYPEDMSFDRIIITAAVPEIPQPLINQLKNGGIIVAPVGSLGVQTLVKAVKNNDKLNEKPVCGVRFVPLIGEKGFSQ
jgi:protein-L-isoaspartate(D-aspartate) O-methyltransferase